MLRILSIEKARGLEVRGEGWGPRGSSGRPGIVRNGLNRKGLVRGREQGGGEARVEPEWNEEDSGDSGEEAEDPGESHTLMRGEPASEARGSGSEGSILMRPDPGDCGLVTSMSRV